MMQVLEKFLAKKWMIFALFLSMTYLFGTKTDRWYGWSSANPKEATPVYSDAAAYYAFLPNWFIYEGNKFRFIDTIRQKYPDTGFGDALEADKNGLIHNKYYSGTAQCLTPFFLIGHAQAHMVGADTDGYSWPYMFWLNIGMVFYAVIGLVALFILLRRLKLGYFACYVAVLSIALGTNFSYYVYVEIPYPHILCFSLVNWCLLQGLKWIRGNQTGTLLSFAFLLGLCFTLRPTNMLILSLVPFLFASTEAFKERMILLVKDWKWLLVSLGLFAIPVIIQVYSFYLQNGEIRLNSYTEEGFSNWNNPYMLEILVGFRKGIFIYGPIMLLMIPGLVVLFFKNKRLFAGVLVFILLSSYVLSSWWCWWYGGSLGFRPIIDFYGIWVIPVAYLAHYARVAGRILIIIAVSLFIWVYQTYELQKKHDILHYDSMNYNMWKTVFMKTDPRFNYGFFSDWDTIPEQGIQIGEASYFYDGNEPLIPGKVYGFNGKRLYPEKAYIQKSVHQKDSNEYVGLRIAMKGYLNSDGENPYMYSEYFKNGVKVNVKEMKVGPRFSKVKTWQNITVDIIPDLRWREVDSVTCTFITSREALQFKDLQLQFFKFK